MKSDNYFFSDVTLLITHYNRSSSLKRLLESFKKENCTFKSIVVSDDGSSEKHFDIVKQLEQQFSFKLVSTEQNKGLGNNINKGQDAVTTEFTLYVQEDFIPTSIFAENFNNALDIIRNESKWDIVRFYAYQMYPYTKPYAKGFSEMMYNRWNAKASKLHYYSDHPHLRRSNFFEKFGRYPEGRSSPETEYTKCVDFIKKRGKGLFFNDFKSLFLQINSSEEPSTWQKKSWKTSNNPAIKLLRGIYQQVKYNYDLNF